jgi:hypothetical protein
MKKVKSHRRFHLFSFYTRSRRTYPLKWTPAAPKEKIPSLLNKNGEFYKSHQLAAAHPKLDEILLEYEAQWNRLTSLGLEVKYVDSHMAPELLIPELEKALEEWISRKGLIDASKYYYFRFHPFLLGETIRKVFFTIVKCG